MDPQHWHDRWENRQIGFHQQQINTHLETFWPRSAITEGCRVFVPLCGKSLDMLWLRSQGHQVIGVELSRTAVSEFFTENALPAQVQSDARFERWSCDGLTLLVGDYFDLTADDLAGCGAVYDRASLVALPAAMRADYARHMKAIKPAHATSLLISMEYPQEKMDGPPFSVEEAEILTLYADTYEVTCVYQEDSLAANPKFRERGLDYMREKVYRLAPATGG